MSIFKIKNKRGIAPLIFVIGFILLFVLLLPLFVTILIDAIKWFAIFSAIVLLLVWFINKKGKKNKNKSKKGLFWILLIATILNIFIPDPIPVIDEILLTFFTLKQGAESF